MAGHKPSHADLTNAANDGVVRIGSRVQVRYSGHDGEPDEFAIVAHEDADAMADRVSVESPIGRALLGHRAGERVLFRAPGGVTGATLVKVR